MLSKQFDRNSVFLILLACVSGAPAEPTAGASIAGGLGLQFCDPVKLLAGDAANFDQFGTTVSVSGEVALVGAWLDDDNGSESGSAYVFRWNGTAWIQEQKLLPDDVPRGPGFGISVSVSGDVALVGTFKDHTVNGVASGSAYVFRWNGTTWVQEQKLLAGDGADYDWFGASVSISADVALVGAVQDDDNGSNSGSAYVFRWNGTAWLQEQKLLPDDGAAFDSFGISVSVSGDFALVGEKNDDDNGNESGSAYLFRWDGTAWVQEQKFLPDDGSARDLFGRSVSVSGDVSLVGAMRDDDNGQNSGSAYVFSSAGSDCNLNGVPDRCDIANGSSRDMDGNGIPDICTDLCELPKLLADDGAREDRFGSSVSVSGDVALVGALGDDDNGTFSGSAYLFRWHGTAWIQEQKLLPIDGAEADTFGNSVCVSGDVVLVGAYQDDDNGSNSGSAYVFRWNGTTWVQEQKLLAGDGAADQGQRA